MPNKFENKQDSPDYLNIPKKKETESDILSPKKVFSVIFIVCLAAIILGFFHLGNLIKSPFAAPSSTNSSSLSLLTNSQVATLVDLQDKDTDSDGLSDYDELYKYNTSPYLKDSDSDGLSDKQEIDRGTDPNCPEGKDCTTQKVLANSNTNTSIFSSNSNVNSTNSNINPAIITGNITAAELRETLKNAGAPADALNNTDDATLMQIYQDTLIEQGTNLNINSAISNLNTNTSISLNTNASIPSNINASALTLDSLKNLSASEIRSLLQSYGVDSQTINSLDDATLKTIFLQAINETASQ